MKIMSCYICFLDSASSLNILWEISLCGHMSLWFIHFITVKYSIIWLHHSDSIYCCWAIRLFLILTIVSNMLCTLLYTSSGTHMHAHSVSLNLSNYCWIVFHGASPVHILINCVNIPISSHWVFHCHFNKINPLFIFVRCLVMSVSCFLLGFLSYWKRSPF